MDRLERVREPFLVALRVGASMAEAARLVKIPVRTVQNWIDRGGREQDGPFAVFAADVKAAREDVRSGSMDLEELSEVVARSARGGSVQAMKLALDLIREGRQDAAKPSDSLSALDELAARRSSQAKGA